MCLKFPNCNLVSTLIIPILFFMLFYNTTHCIRGNHSYNDYSLNFLQNSYAIESTMRSKVNTQDEKDDNKDFKESNDQEESDNNNKGKSIFNYIYIQDGIVQMKQKIQ